MFLTSLYLFIIGRKLKRSNTQFFNFWVLSILSIIDSSIYITYIIILNEVLYFNEISKWWQLIYILIEFYIISNFLININKLHNAKYIKIFIALISILMFTFSIINNWDFKEKYYTLITIIELLFINIFSIRYLLFQTPEFHNSNSKSITNLVKGLFLFINISSPYFIIIQFIANTSNSILSSLSFINHIAYTILFISIIKSIKWQEK